MRHLESSDLVAAREASAIDGAGFAEVVLFHVDARRVFLRALQARRHAGQRFKSGGGNRFAAQAAQWFLRLLLSLGFAHGSPVVMIGFPRRSWDAHLPISSRRGCGYGPGGMRTSRPSRP